MEHAIICLEEQQDEIDFKFQTFKMEGKISPVPCGRSWAVTGATHTYVLLFSLGSNGNRESTGNGQQP